MLPSPLISRARENAALSAEPHTESAAEAASQVYILLVQNNDGILSYHKQA